MANNLHNKRLDPKQGKTKKKMLPPKELEYGLSGSDYGESKYSRNHHK